MVDLLEGMDEVDFGVSPEEIKKASEGEGFQDQGEVSVSLDQDFLEFDSGFLGKKLKPFMQKKAVSRDIITRSLYIKTFQDYVEFYSTDAVSFLYASVPVTNNNFPKEVIIDTESFYVVSRTHKVKTHLIHRGEKFFSKFYGGEIFVPSYRLSSEVFKPSFGDVVSGGELGVMEFKASLESLYPIVSSSDSPDLGYIFFEPGGAYASNGVVIARTKYSGPFFVIRQSDVKLILEVLDSLESMEMYLSESESFYRIESSGFSYTFPKVDVSLSESYKNLFEKPICRYYVNLPYISGILDVLGKMPEFSGVVEFIAEGSQIRGSALTKKGEESSFDISTSSEGTGSGTSFKVAVSIKALQVAFKVFKGEASISSGFVGSKMVYESGGKECIIVLKK